MKLLKSAVLAALMTTAGSYALAQNGAMSGQEFAAMAAGSDMLEIQSSELAIQNGQSEAVKDFARTMVSDHQMASKNLAAAAKEDGVTVTMQMTNEQAAMMDALKSATGADFDTKYVQAQVMAHQKALALMESYAANGEAPALKAHALKTAPVIQMHLEHAQSMANGM